MLDLNILEKQLEDALENITFEKLVFKKKNLNRIKYVPNNKNQYKRTRKVWVEKGIDYSMNACVATGFYCLKNGHTSHTCNIKHFDVPNRKYAWVPVVK